MSRRLITTIVLALLVLFVAWYIRGREFKTINEAIAAGDARAVERLLIDGSSPNEHADGEAHPLILAVSLQHLEIARLLLEAGADVETTMPVDVMQSVLQTAETQRSWWMPEDAESLKDILAGPEFEILRQRHVITPLALAAESGQDSMVRLLLAHGANIEAPVAFGTRPLHQAAFNGRVQVVATLIEYGADLDALDDVGDTPITHAAGRGHIQVLELLFAAGADPHRAGDRGDTAPYQAAMYDQIESLEFFDTNGVRLDAPHPRHGFTPIHGAALEDAAKSIDFLAKHGVDVNIPANSGVTPLHVAASAGQLEAVELLLSLGANPSLKMENGSTPADIARKYGHDEVATLLEPQ